MPYIFPQENGGRADTQWVALRDARGRGLAFVCTANSAGLPHPPCDAAGATAAAFAAGPPALRLISASRHSVAELEAAKHQHELPARGPRDPVHVHLDATHMGVGGDDSWSPSVHDAYLVRPAVYKFGIALLPLTA